MVALEISTAGQQAAKHVIPSDGRTTKMQISLLFLPFPLSKPKRHNGKTPAGRHFLASEQRERWSSLEAFDLT